MQHRRRPPTLLPRSLPHPPERDEDDGTGNSWARQREGCGNTLMTLSKAGAGVAGDHVSAEQRGV